MNMTEIYQNYTELVYKFLLSLCQDENMAEELTQETFYQAIRSSARFDGTCKVSTWLCQIAKHLWYRELEKNERQPTTEIDENIKSHGQSIEDALCLKAEKMQLFKKVHKLDSVAKEVFLLRITGAFSFREIGEILQKNENWARVTFYRAKQKIMKG